MTESRPASAPEYALSLKQPWATLLVHGLKTIEVRRWQTRPRGPLLIHAARIPDPRPEAWLYVPEHLREHARRCVGGVVGRGHLTGCVRYRTREAFVADLRRHLNHPDWFESKGLYGFVFDRLEVLDFYPCPGQTRFFRVTLPTRPAPRTE